MKIHTIFESLQHKIRLSVGGGGEVFWLYDTATGDSVADGEFDEAAGKVVVTYYFHDSGLESIQFYPAELLNGCPSSLALYLKSEWQELEKAMNSQLSSRY